ncbi:hypothetical protein D7W09_01550 [bacterium D16-34]|nr:hypothetical protein D7W09_01550 [bacterium D16-34]
MLRCCLQGFGAAIPPQASSQPSPQIRDLQVLAGKCPLSAKSPPFGGRKHRQGHFSNHFAVENPDKGTFPAKTYEKVLRTAEAAEAVEPVEAAEPTEAAEAADNAEAAEKTPQDFSNRFAL